MASSRTSAARTWLVSGMSALIDTDANFRSAARPWRFGAGVVTGEQTVDLIEALQQLGDVGQVFAPCRAKGMDQVREAVWTRGGRTNVGDSEVLVDQVVQRGTDLLPRGDREPSGHRVGEGVDSDRRGSRSYHGSHDRGVLDDRLAQRRVAADANVGRQGDDRAAIAVDGPLFAATSRRERSCGCRSTLLIKCVSRPPSGRAREEGKRIGSVKRTALSHIRW